MHFLANCLILVLTICTLTFAYRLNDYIEVHDINGNQLTEIKQLPPQDPAIHSFPTVPTAPLIPTCPEEGYFRDPFNCKKFYYCKYKMAVPLGFYCQHGLTFSTVSNSCDRPEYVNC